ncbi:MAG: SGNH/GDSL hydrolase family protein [Labilithrix sp.]|nr:SGNH/GDSL hydrolase family protein [Labilithrix sp.]
MRRAIRSFGVALVALCLCGALGCSRDGNPRETSSPGRTVTKESDAAAEIRHLALGDSFTAGTGTSIEHAFPSRLAARWRARGKRVILKNVAVNGFTTDDVLRVEIPEIAPFRPTLVTIAVGANDRVRGDGPEKYRAQARAVLKAIVDAGVPPRRIVALPQPDWSVSPIAASFGDPSVLANDIIAFNRVLREEAEATGARYVDLFPLMRKEADAKMLAPDGLHPSAEAHDEWAAALEEPLLEP